MNQNESHKRPVSPPDPVSLQSLSDTVIGQSQRKYLNPTYKHTPTPIDSIESFNPELLEQREISRQSTWSSDNTVLQNEEGVVFNENKYVSSIFCMHFVLIIIATAAVVLALYQESLKFLIQGNYVFYTCIGVLMGIVYVMILLRQLFRNKVSMLQRKTEYWDIIFLLLLGSVLAVLLATISAYHDTEEVLFACVSIGTVYWVTALSAALSKSSIMGWRMYIIALSVISILFMVEMFLLCFKVQCESIREIAYATVGASAVSLHTVYATHVILKKKWKTLTPKDNTNAPILIYIFIPIVILHALTKC